MDDDKERITPDEVVLRARRIAREKEVTKNPIMSIFNGLFGSKKTSGITSPFDPKPELQSESGVKNYLSKLTKLDRPGICVEFANVRAAKHNLMASGAGLGNFAQVQTLVTDLTDKSTLICMFAFSREAVLGYAGGDLASFNELVNELDDEIAALDLEPEQQGHRFFLSLRPHLLR